MSRHLRTIRLVLLTVFCVTAFSLGGGKNLLASSCGSPTYNPNGVWYWACGWSSSDLCSDGTVQMWCDDDCYFYHNMQNGGS